MLSSATVAVFAGGAVYSVVTVMVVFIAFDAFLPLAFVGSVLGPIVGIWVTLKTQNYPASRSRAYGTSVAGILVGMALAFLFTIMVLGGVQTLQAIGESSGGLGVFAWLLVPILFFLVPLPATLVILIVMVETLRRKTARGPTASDRYIADPKWKDLLR